MFENEIQIEISLLKRGKQNLITLYISSLLLEYTQSKKSFFRDRKTHWEWFSLSQVVQTTSFIDVSFVYGPLPDKARDLRSFSRGQLTVRRVNGKAYLPLDDPSECPFAPKFCYKAGKWRRESELFIPFRFILKYITFNRDWSNWRSVQLPNASLYKWFTRSSCTNGGSEDLWVVIKVWG